MDFQLMVNIKVRRTKFIKENSVESDDIFALVKSGCFKFSTKNGNYIISENEGVLFRKNEFYQRKIISPVTMYFFRYKACETLFKEEKIVFENIDRIKSTIAMLDLLENDIFTDEYNLRSSIFSDIITQYRLEKRIIACTANKTDESIQIAIADIKENLHKKIILPQIAEKCELSYVQFIRRFKLSTGMTPSNYIILLRVQKAKAMLSNTDLPIRDIASACGFEDEYYFSNFFKKQIGISPTAFRKSTI